MNTEVTKLVLTAEEEVFFNGLSRREAKDVKLGIAKIMACKHCGKLSLYGGMELISIAIKDHHPVCSYACNRALGQVI